MSSLDQIMSPESMRGVQLHRSWPGLAGGHCSHPRHLDFQKQEDDRQDETNILKSKWNISILKIGQVKNR